VPKHSSSGMERSTQNQGDDVTVAASCFSKRKVNLYMWYDQERSRYLRTLRKMNSGAAIVFDQRRATAAFRSGFWGNLHVGLMEH
jgi:hypothetical protein